MEATVHVLDLKSDSSDDSFKIHAVLSTLWYLRMLYIRNCLAQIAQPIKPKMCQQLWPQRFVNCRKCSTWSLTWPRLLWNAIAKLRTVCDRAGSTERLKLTRKWFSVLIDLGNDSYCFGETYFSSSIAILSLHKGGESKRFWHINFP